MEELNNNCPICNGPIRGFTEKDEAYYECDVCGYCGPKIKIQETLAYARVVAKELFYDNPLGKFENVQPKEHIEPCPFCGNDNPNEFYIDARDNNVRILCNYCECAGPRIEFANKGTSSDKPSIFEARKLCFKKWNREK